MKKHALLNYYDNIESYIDDASKNNNKLYWKLLKDVFHTKPGNELPPIKYTDSNGKDSIAFSDIDKIEILNEYFSSISNISNTGKSVPEMFLQCDDSLEDIIIEEYEVIDIISVLLVNKAIGPDCISHKMLKATIHTVCKPLQLLFNRSLSEKAFPDCWKLAHVLPLFKKEDPSLSCNYRPVSLLSCVSKIMERIIFKHVYNYFHRNNLFFKYQAGFLPGHSTVYQLIETYHSIVKNIDEGKSCCMVFCDLSKAFDRVWHEGLLFKLQTYGMRGNLFQWFKSYLYNRQQKVMYKDLLSNSLKINAGVPQGSVLGPLLFLIYVNDVAHNMLSFCRLYADDNSIQYADKNLKNIECVLNHDLRILEKWSEDWLLQFNPNKTKVLFFGKLAHNQIPQLLFQGCQLEIVSSHKHLGLIFSDDLKWSVYIDNIVNHAYKKLGLIKKLKFTLCREKLSKMYITFVRPILEYASVVWDGCAISDLEKLEKVQLTCCKNCNRFVYFGIKRIFIL